MEPSPSGTMTDRPDHQLSKDGSSTLYSNTFNQYYHNPNGAVAESRHVFFETPGVPEHLQKNLSLTILEVGFGTGLNFLLAADYHLRSGNEQTLNFYSVEAFPVKAETARQFNYAGVIGRPEFADLLPELFQSLRPGLNSFTPIDGRPVHLHIFYGPFREMDFPDIKADFIFHDPFSPEVNDELWTEAAFTKLLQYAHQRSLLSTYCAASKARGAMASAGWKAARAKGALGKREMTLASPQPDMLSGFRLLNNDRLAERYRSGEFE